MSNKVNCYKENEPPEFNIHDPYKLPFSKDTIFQDQGEHRLVFGGKKAFRIEKSIVTNVGYDFRKKAMQGVAKEKVMQIGNMNDIAKVLNRNT